MQSAFAAIGVGRGVHRSVRTELGQRLSSCMWRSSGRQVLVWAAQRLRVKAPASSESGDSQRLIALALGLFLATSTLVWFGYVATREWQRGTRLLQERQAAEVLALANLALARDMTGAWTSLVVPVNPVALREDPPYDLLQQVQQAFARFPYPESYIIWNDRAEAKTYVFNRADRPPAWDTSERTEDPFPVVMLQDPPGLRPLTDMARQRAGDGQRFALFDIDLAGSRYQVVAHLMFSPLDPGTLIGLAAFTVDLEWVRRQYFHPLIEQIAQIGGLDAGVALSVLDEKGRLVAGSPLTATTVAAGQRSFPLAFLEPTAIASLRAGDLRVPTWTLRVDASQDAGASTLSAALRMFGLIALAALATVIGLLQTIRGFRARARVTAMKSEFVTAVTHELKTPLALIRLVADTLAQGRYASPDVIPEYAGLLSQEAARLTQSVNHLLTFARYAENSGKAVPDSAPHDVADIVEDSLERFRPTLTESSFTVTTDVPRHLPRVRVDRRAVVDVFEILLDNAIRYSEDVRTIDVSGRANGRFVKVTIADHGVGIPADQIAKVFERFYRARNAKGDGSGLGLAISRRILQQNGGDIHIRSTLGVGTEVECLLPVA